MYKKISNTKFAILNFVKNLVSKALYNDIKRLLEPCCVPSIVFGTFSCDTTDEVTGVLLEDVTITATGFSNKTVTAILTSTDASGGVIQEITFDERGIWEGDLQSSWFAYADGDITVKLSLLSENSEVLVFSEEQTITIPNCG
jgi:hypothetical protein